MEGEGKKEEEKKRSDILIHGYLCHVPPPTMYMIELAYLGDDLIGGRRKERGRSR